MEIRVWKFDDSNIRTVELDGTPWFVGKDVAAVLGYANINKAVQMHVDEEDVKKLDFTSFSQNGNFKKLWNNPSDFSAKIIINESGVYSLIFGSKLPNAKRFKHFVTSEVLPAIRKHGAYMEEEVIRKAIQSPEVVIKLAMELREEKEKTNTLEAQIAEDAPKVEFANAVDKRDTTILVYELARILKQNGVQIGGKRLYAWLRSNGYLCKRGDSYNMPTYKSIKGKHMVICEYVIPNPNGGKIIKKVARVTGSGQRYFVNKFLKMQRGGMV